MTGKLGSFFGIGKQITKNSQGNLGGGLGYETESRHGFEGQGTTSRAGTLQGRLTCRVLEVMRNGTLKAGDTGSFQPRDSVPGGRGASAPTGHRRRQHDPELAPGRGQDPDSTGLECSATSKVLASFIGL